MEGKKYQMLTAFDGLVADQAVFYQVLLHDRSSPKGVEMAEQFNDLYHLFLNKFARLTSEIKSPEIQEEEMLILLKQLFILRKALEKGGK